VDGVARRTLRRADLRPDVTWSDGGLDAGDVAFSFRAA
jgi:hypothetical protein